MNSPYPDEDISASVPRLIDAALMTFDADRDTSRRYLSSALALFSARREAGGPEHGGYPKLRGGLSAWELNRLVHYIEAHLADKISVKDLASLINVSEGRLFRAFKTSVGVSPRHYVTARRVERVSKMLIATPAPLAQLALACGFCDQAHLSRLFRRKFGMPPSAWRRAMTVQFTGPDVSDKDLRADAGEWAW